MMQIAKFNGITNFIRGIADNVPPHATDARYVENNAKIGYGVSFTRYFYKLQPMRSFEEIRADILAIERETEWLLGEIIGGAEL